jgi:hypothetical protein
MQDGKFVRGPRGLWLCVGLTLLTSSVAFAQDGAASAEPPSDPAGPVEVEKVVFLVTDVVVADGIAIDKEAARDALANRFGRLKDKIEVRSLAEVKTTLDRAAMAQMLGSSASDEEVAKIGEYVQVDRLIFGRIHQVAGVTEVQVKLFNAKEGVTEMALSRRLKAGAPPQLVLTLLDSLADGMLSWVLDTYTDGAPSAGFAALKNKKIVRAEKPVAGAGEAGGMGMLGVVGGVVAGTGVGIATVGGIALAEGGNQAADLPVILAASGAGAVLLGTALIIIDGVN